MAIISYSDNLSAAVARLKYGRSKMKAKIVSIAPLASTAMMGYSTTSFAQTSPDASGSVTTENITPSLQLGNMSLTISDIPKGARLFKDVTSAEVFADGYISNCPGENENAFTLSGVICLE